MINVRFPMVMYREYRLGSPNWSKYLIDATAIASAHASGKTNQHRGKTSGARDMYRNNPRRNEGRLTRMCIGKYFSAVSAL